MLRAKDLILSGGRNGGTGTYKERKRAESRKKYLIGHHKAHEREGDLDGVREKE